MLKRLVFTLGSIGLTAASLMAQFLTTGTPTIDFDMSATSGSTAMNIAWDPVTNQYYGGRGGSSTFSGRVWGSDGTVLQTLTPLNSDLRSFYYNSNTGNIEEVTFNARGVGTSGFLTVGRDVSGLLTGAYTSIGVSLTGLPTSQVVPAYDAVRNLLYAFDNGSIVTVVNRATGLATGTVTLDLASAGSPTLMQYSIGYDPLNDALISFTTSGGNRALAFSATTGSFLSSISLPGLTSPVTSYGLGYANDQFFIFDSSINAYRGFSLVPEPGIPALLGTGLAALAAGWWRRRRASR